MVVEKCVGKVIILSKNDAFSKCLLTCRFFCNPHWSLDPDATELHLAPRLARLRPAALSVIWLTLIQHQKILCSMFVLQKLGSTQELL
jgi:hypothetical protein